MCDDEGGCCPDDDSGQCKDPGSEGGGPGGDNGPGDDGCPYTACVYDAPEEVAYETGGGLGFAAKVSVIVFSRELADQGAGQLLSADPQLISNARKSIEDLFRDKPGCATAIRTAVDSAIAAVKSTNISFATGAVGAINLGPLQIEPNGSVTGFGGAELNGNIYLNANINWSAGQAVACGGGGCEGVVLTIPGVGGGGAQLSPLQILDFYILHELAHTFGMDHASTMTQDAYNLNIFNECFK